VAQSTILYRQSAKLFLQSSELGHPQPLASRRVCPPPGSGGGSQFRRGDIHCGTLYIFVLCLLWAAYYGIKDDLAIISVFPPVSLLLGYPSGLYTGLS
jgi:hypothetical protein